MPLLLALCGNRHDLLAKEVPLNASALEDVSEAFFHQEEAFREGEEIPFDANWLNTGDQISTAPIPENVSIFDDIMRSTDTSLSPIDSANLEEIRGLSMKINADGSEKILVQSFTESQSLTRPWLVSLLFSGGTYTRIEESSFRLDDKLVCIVEDELIKFRSLHNLGRIIDTSAIFAAATDDDVSSFASDYSHLFDIVDSDDFVANASRNARKYIASLMKSEALENHTAKTLENASAGTKLAIEVQNDKIVMPNKSSDITELMRFLNDGRYVGPVSRKPFITNSRRPAT